jgi:hypothetical protein
LTPRARDRNVSRAFAFAVQGATMRAITHRFSRLTPKVAAVAAVVALYGAAREPALPDTARAAMANRFRFERAALEPFAAGSRTVRDVHPAVRHMASWISAVGASIALGDLDGDALPNDYCLVDPRSDRVVAAAVPGTGERFPAFVAAAPSADVTLAPTGCRFGDFNEDGVTDLLVYYWGRAPIVLLRRATVPLASGAAAFRTVDIVPAEERWNTGALTTADVDGDGHLDLVVGNYFPDGSRPLDPNGGDAFTLHRSMARAFNGGSKRVLLWAGGSGGAEPAVRYRDAPLALPAAAAHGWTLAMAAADLDGDLLPEIYIANDFGPDVLLSNRSTPGRVVLVPVYGRKTFMSPTSKVLGRDSFKGMGVDVGDLDGDGVLDLFVSNIANEFALEESHFAWLGTGDRGALKRGVAPFVDRSDSLGLAHGGFGWEARIADFDNDGAAEVMQATGFIRGAVDRWPELQELAMGNNLTIASPRNWPRFAPGDDLSGHQHNPFFVRAPGGRFYDLAPEIGLADPHVARGIAIADVDGDGRLDFAVATQWDTSHVFRNRSAPSGASLELRLLVGGAPAVGASAAIRLPDGRSRVAAVDGGGGHSGQRAAELHFGLGPLTASTPLTVDLTWRDRRGAVRQRQEIVVAEPHTPHLRLTINLDPGM